MPTSPWYVYILECSDGSLYTGCTNDVNKRHAVHNSGKGAKYTRTRLPVKVVYSEKAENRSEASKRESAIKKLSRVGKIQLIEAAVYELQ
jgi:putative endonuclease